MIYKFICSLTLVCTRTTSWDIACRKLVFCRKKLYHHNYPEVYCVKHYLGTFAFQIRKIILNGQIVSPSDFDLRKKNVNFVRGIHVFSIPIHKTVNVVWKDIEFRLKLGFIAFSLSIFRITLWKSSVFRLSISSLNFDWEICSLHQGPVSLKGLSFGRKLVRLTHLVPEDTTA